MKTYSPLPSWPPVVLAAALLLVGRPRFALCTFASGYVIGPFIGKHLSATAARVLIAVDDALADTPTTD